MPRSSPRPTGDSYLVASILGPDHPGIVRELVTAAVNCGCKIKDTRAAVLGTLFSMTLLIGGHWNAIAKAEQSLPRLATRLNLTLALRRTEPRWPPQAAKDTETGPPIPYAVEVIALESSNAVHDIVGFFAERDINIEDMYTTTYPAPHTGAAMISVHVTVGISAELSIAALRGEFMDFCDDLNLDAMLAPVK